MTNNDKTKNYESDDGNENEKKYIYIVIDECTMALKKKMIRNETK